MAVDHVIINLSVGSDSKIAVLMCERSHSTVQHPSLDSF